VLEYPPLAPLTLVIKVFLRSCGLNEVANGGLSSFSITNMVLAHLMQELQVRLGGGGGRRGWACPLCVFLGGGSPNELLASGQKAANLVLALLMLELHVYAFRGRVGRRQS
jgi:hypothetical protein